MRSFLQQRIFATVFAALITFSASPHGALTLYRGPSLAGSEELLENPAQISLCELVSHAAQYHRRRVRIEGIYRVAGQSALYDPNCSEDQNWMAVDFAQSVKGSAKTLDRLVKRDRRAKVIFEGIFFGPEPLQIDPRLPPVLQQKLRGSTRRYGHMDSFNSMILVSAVKHVDEVPASVPW